MLNKRHKHKRPPDGKLTPKGHKYKKGERTYWIHPTKGYRSNVNN